MKQLFNYSIVFVLSQTLFSCGNNKTGSTAGTHQQDSLGMQDTTSPKENSNPVKDSVLPALVTEKGLLNDPWATANPNHPVFHSRRVDEWAHQNQAAPQPGYKVDRYVHDYLSAKQVEQLNAKELIYYCLAYPASYSQICGEPHSSSLKGNTISGYVKMYESNTFSQVQKKALEKNRDSVIVVLKKYLASKPGFPGSYLYLLLKVDAVECIPTVADLASLEETRYYSFMLELLYRHKHRSLLNWKYYNQLYGDQSWEYNSTIPATEENAGVIIKMAHELYNSKK